MASVTRDKKKYGVPSICDDKKHKKEKAELRERELQDQLSNDLNDGRLSNGRRLPIIED